MAEINVQSDCGNAPKKIFLKEYHSAIANGDIEFISTNISDTIQWNIAGGATAAGREDYLNTLQSHPQWKVKKLVIESIITHGIDASVNGYVITAGNLKFSFCDIYKFKGFKGSTIKSVTTFFMQEKT